jgi:hypothetical protein
MGTHLGMDLHGDIAQVLVQAAGIRLDLRALQALGNNGLTLVLSLGLSTNLVQAFRCHSVI